MNLKQPRHSNLVPKPFTHLLKKTESTGSFELKRMSFSGGKPRIHDEFTPVNMTKFGKTETEVTAHFDQRASL